MKTAHTSRGQTGKYRGNSQQETQFQVPLPYSDGRENNPQYLQNVQEFMSERAEDGTPVLDIYESQFLADLEHDEEQRGWPNTDYRDVLVETRQLQNHLTNLARGYSAEEVTKMYTAFAKKNVEEDAHMNMTDGPWSEEYLELAQEHSPEEVVDHYMESVQHEQRRESEDLTPRVGSNVAWDDDQIWLPMDQIFDAMR